MIHYIFIISFLFLNFVSKALHAQYEISFERVLDEGAKSMTSTHLTISKKYEKGEVVWGGPISIDPDNVVSAQIVSDAKNSSLKCEIYEKSTEKARAFTFDIQEIRTSNVPDISVNDASQTALGQNPIYIQNSDLPWEFWSYVDFPQEIIIEVKPLNYILCKNNLFFAYYEIHYKNSRIENFCLRLPKTLENLKRIIAVS